ncbi:MAG TPA: DUF6286 domain-containing protein [Actinomadura sp.]|jgi:hypothetical protein|nr:DUF6286 domain-containing protein [Actinomadura sp.]
MRVLNRIVTLLLSLVLIVGGLLVAVEAVLAAFHRAPWLLPVRRWHDILAGTRLADPSTVTVAATLGAVGLVLLIAELWPWRPYRLPARPATADDRTRWWVLRRPAERRLADAAANVPGVNTARVRLRGRRRWKVHVRAEARDDSRAGIEEAVNAELARLAAPAPARVRLRLRRPRRVT